MQVVIELSEEILAYSFAILRLAKLLNARRVDIFEFHFGLDGKERKLNSTTKTGLVTSPLTLVLNQIAKPLAGFVNLFRKPIQRVLGRVLGGLSDAVSTGASVSQDIQNSV